MVDPIDSPGIYPDLPEALYHQDPVIEPSLSRSVGKHFISDTPRHVFQKHPRLNPDFEAVQRTDFDLGKAAHRLMLQGLRGFAVIDADAFRSKEAKRQRDEAYNEGKIPLLAHKLPEVEAMVATGKVQIAHHQEIRYAFETCRPEVTMVWREETPHGMVWCRSRVDLFPDKGTIVIDYKSTTDANPENWRNRCFDLGYDIQAGFIRRGLRALASIESADFRFVVQETKPPYALCVMGLEPEALAMGDEKAARMVEMWAWCRNHNAWPGYPKHTCYIGAPPWEATKWASTKQRPEMYGVAAEDWHTLLLDWQAPLEGPKEWLADE